MQTKCTDLEGEAAEYCAVVAAGEPEDERVILAAGLRLDEVVEKLTAVVLVHLHVPDGDGGTHPVWRLSG